MRSPEGKLLNVVRPDSDLQCFDFIVKLLEFFRGEFSARVSATFFKSVQLIVQEVTNMHVNFIGAAFSTELDRGFRQAQQHSATVLEAVLAGVQVGRA